MTAPPVLLALLVATPQGVRMDSLLDMVWSGGPLMVPIGLCSVVALALVVERSIRLREGELGSRRLGKAIVELARTQGPSAATGLCEERATPLGRVLAAGLRRAAAPFAEREKAVEDAGMREVKRLSTPLKALALIAVVAPLLGLLGTVWGMIQAFSEIALQEGLGKPEQLAGGISQALITTAAGLCIAIPTQAAIFWLRARVDRFARRAEDLYVELEPVLRAPARPEPAPGAPAVREAALEAAAGGVA